jgi:hypothetical protein
MLRVLLLAGRLSAFGLPGPGGAQASVGGGKLPFTGSFTGSSAHNLSTGQFHSVWTGEASHFGISNLEQDAQIAITDSTHVGFAGTWTLTSANGDQLYGTAVGAGIRTDATHITLVIDYTASGGTGRFADAGAIFTMLAHHARTALENGISYGEQQATLDGQLAEATTSSPA